MYVFLAACFILCKFGPSHSYERQMITIL